MFSFGSRTTPVSLLGSRSSSPAASTSVIPPVGQPRKNSKGTPTTLELLKCTTSGKSNHSLGSLPTDREKARSPANKRSVAIVNGIVIQNVSPEKRDFLSRESSKAKEAAAVKADANLIDQVYYFLIIESMPTARITNSVNFVDFC